MDPLSIQLKKQKKKKKHKENQSSQGRNAKLINTKA